MYLPPSHCPQGRWGRTFHASSPSSGEWSGKPRGCEMSERWRTSALMFFWGVIKMMMKKKQQQWGQKINNFRRRNNILKEHEYCARRRLHDNKRISEFWSDHRSNTRTQSLGIPEKVPAVIPAAVSHFNEFQDILCALDLLLLQPHHLHLLFPVLQYPQLSFTIQQVKHLQTQFCQY